MDTYKSKTTVAKPFGSSIENFTEKVFANRSGGGTPLRYTLRFARERIERGENDIPFMIVITDGRPRKIDKVKEEIKKAQFPVIGLYLNGGSGSEDQLKLYDRAVSIDSKNDDITQKLIQLINSIAF